MENWPAWETLLLWSGIISVGAFVATVAGVPLVVWRLPHDYFSRRRRQVLRDPPVAMVYQAALAALKNIVGAGLVALGLLMLVTPGQGLLTVLVGLLLMNFPGKYRVERWLVMRPGVLRALNWLRRRRGLPPLDTPRAQDLSGQ